MCRTAGISKSTYYRLRNVKNIKDKYLDLIYKVFKESHQTYGHRRITLALRQEHNVVLNKKKVARIMKENVIIPEYHKKKPKSAEEQKLIAFDWIWFYMNKRISLPKKITKNKVFSYDKAIEKAKEFEKLKLKKIKLN